MIVQVPKRDKKKLKYQSEKTYILQGSNHKLTSNFNKVEWLKP